MPLVQVSEPVKRQLDARQIALRQMLGRQVTMTEVIEALLELASARGSETP